MASKTLSKTVSSKAKVELVEDEVVQPVVKTKSKAVSVAVANPTVELVEDEVSQPVEKTKTKAVKEPVPETEQQDIAENKSEFETYEDVATARAEILAAIKKYNARLTFLDKEANRLHHKVAKEAKKKNKRVNTDPNKKPAGFETPVPIPDKFYKFISNGLKNNKFSEEKTLELNEKNLQSDSLIARSIVTRMVYDYIKHSNLYEENSEQNKRFIKPDEAVKTLFSMTNEEEIGFFNFQTYVCRLFPKKVKAQEEVEVDEDEEEVEEEAAEEEEEVKPEPEPVKKKSTKSKTASAV
jgi:hypothetical protein